MKEEIKVQIFEFIVILITISGLFLWSRSESRGMFDDSKNDVRRMEDVIESIHQETKDFHGRLCTIEERERTWTAKQ